MHFPKHYQQIHNTFFFILCYFLFCSLSINTNKIYLLTICYPFQFNCSKKKIHCSQLTHVRGLSKYYVDRTPNVNLLSVFSLSYTVLFQDTLSNNTQQFKTVLYLYFKKKEKLVTTSFARQRNERRRIIPVLASLLHVNPPHRLRKHLLFTFENVLENTCTFF